MRFLVGADYEANPDSGAAGTVFQSICALRELGCEVDEFWSRDLGRRIRHGNLHYLLELPRSMRRAVVARCRQKAYGAVLLSQPHAFLAGEYLRATHPHTLFLNRTHGWEGQVDEIMQRIRKPFGLPSSCVRSFAQERMRSLLARHQERVVRCADGIVAGCSSVARHLAKTYGYPIEQVGVIPHGVPAAYLADPIPSAGEDKWRNILYVGQYTPIKAPNVVARVLNDVLTRHPDAKGGWVCDAAHHLEVRQRLEPGIRDRVTLHPWSEQDALIGIYDRYGIFIFPSYYEGYGKTPFEAMARGLAVVSAAVGGMADSIHSGENGVLCDLGNAGEMVREVDRLLGDPSLARRLGATAIETARGLTWEHHARELVAFVDRLRAEKRRNFSRIQDGHPDLPAGNRLPEIR